MHALNRVSSAAHPGVWQGPAADRFTDQIGAERRRLSAIADDLTLLVRLLIQRAEMLESQREALIDGFLENLTHPPPGPAGGPRPSF